MADQDEILLVFVSEDKTEVSLGLSCDEKVDRREECNYHIRTVIWSFTPTPATITKHTTPPLRPNIIIIIITITAKVMVRQYTTEMPNEYYSLENISLVSDVLLYLFIFYLEDWGWLYCRPASLCVDLYFHWKPTRKVNQADKLCLARALVNGGWIRQGISYKQQEAHFRLTNQQPTVQVGFQTNNFINKIK